MAPVALSLNNFKNFTTKKHKPHELLLRKILPVRVVRASSWYISLYFYSRRNVLSVSEKSAPEVFFTHKSLKIKTASVSARLSIRALPLS